MLFTVAVAMRSCAKAWWWRWGRWDSVGTSEMMDGVVADGVAGAGERAGVTGVGRVVEVAAADVEAGVAPSLPV